MKKRLVALFSVLVIGTMMLLAGCGSSDSGPLEGSPVLGEWKVCGAEYIGWELTLEDLEWTPDSVTATITADGKIKMTSDDGDFNGTLTDNGDETYTLSVEEGDFVFYIDDDGRLVSDWSDYMDSMYIYFTK